MIMVLRRCPIMKDVLDILDQQEGPEKPRITRLNQVFNGVPRELAQSREFRWILVNLLKQEIF